MRWPASTSVIGAAVAGVGLGLDTTASGTLGRWVYIIGKFFVAALLALSVLAYAAQSRREAIGRAKSHAHELAVRATYGHLVFEAGELDRTAADLVLLEDAHA